MITVAKEEGVDLFHANLAVDTLLAICAASYV